MKITAPDFADIIKMVHGLFMEVTLFKSFSGHVQMLISSGEKFPH